jgi:hypothetical protein
VPSYASALAAAASDRDGWLDWQRSLLRELSITCFLSEAHERFELVVESIGILKARVDDLESQIAHRVRLGESLEDHFADPL